MQLTCTPASPSSAQSVSARIHSNALPALYVPKLIEPCVPPFELTMPMPPRRRRPTGRTAPKRPRLRPSSQRPRFPGRHRPDHAVLHERRDEVPVAREHLAPAVTPAPARVRAALIEEQPLPRVERLVERER